MPFGPRLDRPSAVGDEGRPRETSLGVATAVVLVVSLGVGIVIGDPVFFTGFALVVGLTVAGMALLERDRVRETVVGHLLFLPGASTLFVVVFLSGGPGLVVAGTAAALAGIGGAWADVGDGPSVKRALKSGIVSYVFGLVWFAIAGLGVGFALGFWNVATGLAGGTRPAWALAGFWFVLGTVCLCVRLALWAIPATELAPRDSERRVQRRFGRLGRRLVLVWLGTFVLTWVFALLALSGSFRGVALGPGALLVEALTSELVILPLVALCGVSLGVALLATLARKTTTEYDASTSGTVAAALAGAGYVGIVTILALSAGLFPVVAVVIVLASVVLPILVFLALALAVVAIELEIMPDGAAPLALAATGLVAVAVAAAGLGTPPGTGASGLLVFGATAGALVVWDVGTFGLGVTAELGHLPDTRRLELYHGVFAVGVGVVAVLAVTVADAAVRPVGASLGTPAAMAVAAVGVLLVLVTLRP
jgi:hypothetical protein